MKKEDEDIVNTYEDSSVLKLAYLLAKRTVPVCMGFIIMYINNFITMSFAGHFSNIHSSNPSMVESNAIFATSNPSVVQSNVLFATSNPSIVQSNVIFAGIALAIMYANVTFSSLIIGMSSAIDTLASQHYGAGNNVEVGIVLQRSCMVCLMIAIPLVSTWFFSKDLFLYFGIAEPVAIVVQQYLTWRALGVPVDIVTISYDKYLAAIGAVNPQVYANIVQNIALIFFNYIFVVYLQYDYPALALSWVLSSVISLITIYLFSYQHHAVRQTLQPFDIKAFTKWGEFMSLGFPATFMLISEWWAFEFLTLCASTLGTAEVAAQTVMMQTTYLCYMIPYGLSSAGSSLVGNFIGARKLAVAIRMAKLVIYVDIVCQLIVGRMILLCGQYIIGSFTNDISIVRIAVLILPILPFLTLFDGLSAVAAGVLRGAGKQIYGAYSNLTSFYVVGLPCALFLCFHTTMQVRGLMTGITLGSGVQALFLLSLIFCGEKYVFTSSITPSQDSKRSHQNEIVSVENHAYISIPEAVTELVNRTIVSGSFNRYSPIPDEVQSSKV